MIGGSNRMLNMRETAEFLGVSHKSLQSNWRRWGLPAYRIGKRVQFRERDLEAWLAKQSVTSGD